MFGYDILNYFLISPRSLKINKIRFHPLFLCLFQKKISLTQLTPSLLRSSHSNLTTMRSHVHPPGTTTFLPCLSVSHPSIVSFSGGMGMQSAEMSLLLSADVIFPVAICKTESRMAQVGRGRLWPWHRG